MAKSSLHFDNWLRYSITNDIKLLKIIERSAKVLQGLCYLKYEIDKPFQLTYRLWQVIHWLNSSNC